MYKPLKNQHLEIKQSLKNKQPLKNKQSLKNNQLKRKEESFSKRNELEGCPPQDENYIVVYMEDLLLIEFYLRLLGIIDENGKYITGYCHSKLMLGLALQLLQQGFFRKKDQSGHKVTLITAVQYFMKRYKMPKPQRIYRDEEVCLAYANVKLPVIKQIRHSRTTFFIKRPKLIYS